jgi:hypothetical protein
MGAHDSTRGAQVGSQEILPQETNQPPAPSSTSNPCQICGGKDGSCGIEPSAALCNYQPENGPWEGDHRKGRDGRYWNFTGRDSNDRAFFLLHRFSDYDPRNLEDVRGHLREAIEEGLSASELQQLVAQLAAKTNQPLLVVQRMAEAIVDSSGTPPGAATSSRVRIQAMTKVAKGMRMPIPGL